MLEKSSLKKLNYLFTALSILFLLIGFFALKFDNISISSIPTIEISLLNPIYNIINDLCSNDLAILINNLLTINIAYYVFIVLPFSLFNFVKGLLIWKK